MSRGGARTYTRPRPPLPRRRPLYRRGRGGAPPAAPRRPPPLPPPFPAPPPSSCSASSSPLPFPRWGAAAAPTVPPEQCRGHCFPLLPPAPRRPARVRPRGRGAARPPPSRRSSARLGARAPSTVCCCLWPCRLVCCRQEGGAAGGWERAGGFGWEKGTAGGRGGRPGKPDAAGVWAPRRPCAARPPALLRSDWSRFGHRGCVRRAPPVTRTRASAWRTRGTPPGLVRPLLPPPPPPPPPAVPPPTPGHEPARFGMDTRAE